MEIIPRKYTFVTVVFDLEYELLALQARSMRLYCPLEMIDSIIVIDNSDRPIEPDKKSRIIAEYGSLAETVTFLTAMDVAQVPEANGWWTQQILKLMAAKTIRSERYIILDAKNHFVFNLKPEFLEAPDGRARIKVEGYRNHPLREDLVGVLSYLGVYSDTYLETFTTTTPPFVMYTNIVRELIQNISESEKSSFESVFIQRRFSEFLLYTGYIIQSGVDLTDIYDFHQVSCPTIWEHAADDEGCIKAIACASRWQAPLFSLHRQAIVKLPRSARNLVAEFWYNRKLFESKESANSFISDFRQHYIRRRLHLLRQL